MDAKDFTSPGKVAAFLRVFNAWRRGNEVPESKMPNPRDIGMALDAAVQMLEASDIHSQALHYIAWEASSYVEAVQHAKEAIADTGAIPTPPCSGHAKQQEDDHSEPALELVGQAIRAAVAAERQAIIESIPGGDIVDPQLVCYMIRQRAEVQSSKGGD